MQRLKQSRGASFTVVALVCIMSATVGITVYNALEFSWWIALLIADLAATVVTFIFSLIFGNASVYDPYWSVQPPVILIAFLWGRRPTLLGVLLAVAVGFWAVRLTANWAYTFGGLTHQDWRYTMLSEKTGIFYPVVNLVGIHLVPTLVVYGCILPAVYAVRNELSANIGSVIFIALSVLAALMQGIADIEMQRFRKAEKAVLSASVSGNIRVIRTIWAKFLCGGGSPWRSSAPRRAHRIFFRAQ